MNFFTNVTPANFSFQQKNKLHCLICLEMRREMRLKFEHSLKGLFSDLQLRNRKHVLCSYRVIETQVEVWENEKCCGNTSCR